AVVHRRERGRQQAAGHLERAGIGIVARARKIGAEESRVGGRRGKAGQREEDGCKAARGGESHGVLQEKEGRKSAPPGAAWRLRECYAAPFRQSLMNFLRSSPLSLSLSADALQDFIFSCWVCLGAGFGSSFGGGGGAASPFRQSLMNFLRASPLSLSLSAS